MAIGRGRCRSEAVEGGAGGGEGGGGGGEERNVPRLLLLQRALALELHEELACV